MRIGYACLAVAVPGSEMKTCTMKYATEEHLLALISSNLNSLDKLIDYNIQNGIYLFRISSELIPFGSSIAANLPWHQLFAEKLGSIGSKIIKSAMRVSMHPGQYTVLNSPLQSVVLRSVQDLDYHAKVMDSMGLGPEHKIILHLGGVYGDKDQAKKRFLERYKELPKAVRKRLVLENDDKLFNIRDVLETASTVRIPVVYDNLHNAINPADDDSADIDWIRRCAATWKKSDGLQKIHYSQQNSSKKSGAHSDSIDVDAFLDFIRQMEEMEPDVMLEVKDKNISALKGINCMENRGIRKLETEWARYKYCVLERSPALYSEIRQLLRNKDMYPALEMYRIIEASLRIPVVTGNAVNAAQHVWGYFKNRASDTEKKRFESLLMKFSSGETTLLNIKNNLLRLARKYQEDYLLTGYYLYR